MHFFQFIVASVILVAVQAFDTKPPNILYTTAQRIASYNYPVESHQVVTTDGYVLTLFRIPYSPHQKNHTNPRPVMFVQHGLLSSSDSWILNGPDNALAYLLADAGYDVWMGNHRGNVYSRHNIHISPEKSEFWKFSFNELGKFDLPNMIDYILGKTKQEKLHYVSHSQGTSAFFVLLSEIPEYNKKFKTAHMLAPIAFMSHTKSLISQILSRFPVYFLENQEVFPLIKSESILNSDICSIASSVCAEVLFILGGLDRKNLNNTLLPLVALTHPAGSSSNQMIHYFQETKSGYFRKFDYGKEKNQKLYGQSVPPSYNLSNVLAPIRLYYGQNDKLASLVDVKKLAKLLPNLVESYEIPIKKWNHVDFLWALNVKEFIYNKIIKTANHYEKTGEQL